ncbi:MAG: transposase [Flammeovirgaceae bacterium]|nr:transposase [Flammeovirgaceae bacterium]
MIKASLLNKLLPTQAIAAVQPSKHWKRITSLATSLTSENTNTSEGFIYDKEGDYYTCPQNKKVEFKKIKSNNGHLAKEYRTSRTDCGPCPFRTSCIGKSPEKRIVDTLDKPYYDKMHERLKGSYARKMKKLRQSTVEPVLGTLINFLAMKRVNTRGIKLANKCMLMAAIATT